MNPILALRDRLALLAAAASTGAEALDGAAVDLCPGTLAELLGEVDVLAVRLDLVFDRLGAAVDPVQVGT